MASFIGGIRNTPQRTLRYNAKTSMSTRQHDDVAQSEHFLRNTDGPLKLGLVSSRHSNSINPRPIKKCARQKGADHLNDPVVEEEFAGGAVRTWSSIAQKEVSASAMQMLAELNFTCDMGTSSISKTGDSQIQTTLYIFACGLHCKPGPKAASASSPAQSSPAFINTSRAPCSASKLPVSTFHWHIHTHSPGSRPHGHALLGFLSEKGPQCFDVQLLKGALARMKAKKPWPADQSVLEQFYRVNGGYDLEIVKDGDLEV